MMDDEDDRCTNPVIELRIVLSELQEDVSEFMKEINDKFSKVDETLKDMEQVFEYLPISADPDEENAGSETIQIPSEESGITLNEETLSDVAKDMLCSTEGPLTPEGLKSFLMDKAWGKPKPCILPIARTYSSDIQGIKIQLQSIKKGIKRVHNDYMMGQKRLDDNICRRIDKLLKNIDIELEKEGKENMKQTPISDYVPIVMDEN